MTNEANEIQVIFRQAQSLKNTIKAQSNLKTATDVRPYARQYNIPRGRIIALQIKDALMMDLEKEFNIKPMDDAKEFFEQWRNRSLEDV
jgi:hypothetical protein